MGKSKSPPDYLIKAIARHATALINEPHESIKQMEAARLLKKEIRKLETYLNGSTATEHIAGP